MGGQTARTGTIACRLCAQPKLHRQWPSKSFRKTLDPELKDHLSVQTGATDAMAQILGGTVRMGSDAHYPEARQARDVTVDGSVIDPRAVTGADFAATGVRPRRVSRQLVWVLLVSLSACKVGPDFKTPTAPLAERWLQSGDPSVKIDHQD
jgi:formylglycine-generating enzyme required for sulfatase activity